MYGSYSWGDLALEDLILHCNDELVAGVVPYFNGRHWALLNIGSVMADLPKVVEELEKFKEDFDVMMEKIDEALEKAEELASDNPEEVRFLLVQMDGDKETTENNAWIDEETDVTPTWLSGSPNGIIEHYVGNGFVTIRSSENESGIVRLRLSKPKEGAFLNHL